MSDEVKKTEESNAYALGAFVRDNTVTRAAGGVYRFGRDMKDVTVGGLQEIGGALSYAVKEVREGIKLGVKASRDMIVGAVETTAKVAYACTVGLALKATGYALDKTVGALARWVGEQYNKVTTAVGTAVGDFMAGFKNPNPQKIEQHGKNFAGNVAGHVSDSVREYEKKRGQAQEHDHQKSGPGWELVENSAPAKEVVTATAVAVNLSQLVGAELAKYDGVEQAAMNDQNFKQAIEIAQKLHNENQKPKMTMGEKAQLLAEGMAKTMASGDKEALDQVSQQIKDIEGGKRPSPKEEKEIGKSEAAKKYPEYAAKSKDGMTPDGKLDYTKITTQDAMKIGAGKNKAQQEGVATEVKVSAPGKGSPRNIMVGDKGVVAVQKDDQSFVLTKTGEAQGHKIGKDGKFADAKQNTYGLAPVDKDVQKNNNQAKIDALIKMGVKPQDAATMASAASKMQASGAVGKGTTSIEVATKSAPPQAGKAQEKGKGLAV